MNIEFDIEKLNKRDRASYEAMTASEQERFVRTWIQLENQKARLVQYMNASKERNNREKKVLAERERKERTHRLIERGAILEAYIRDPLDFSNEDIKTIVSRVMQSQAVIEYIEKVRPKGS